MAVTNTLTITYGSHAVGGDGSNGSNQPDGTYQIHGPYVIDKSFTTLRLVFDVVVVANNVGNLFQHCDALETAFSKREENLLITMGPAGDTDTWTYNEGTQALNLTSSISKSGSSDTDRGNSRAYTIVIEGDVAQSSGGGLRDIEFTVDFEPSRRLILALSGVYTRTPGRTASANYLHAEGADAEATTFINSIKTQTRNGASKTVSFELVDEQYTYDRTNHTCQFSRQYAEILANQAATILDHDNIRDHRITFSDVSSHLGQSRKDVTQFNRVSASFDASVDISKTTDMQTLVDTVIRPHIKSLFTETFAAGVQCIEDERVSYDETAKRLSIAIQFIFSKDMGDGQILEVSEAVAYREQRTLDSTPIHGKDELMSEVSVGWMVLERISTRTMMVYGNKQVPKRRLHSGEGPPIKLPQEGPMAMKVADGGTMQPQVRRNGWNIVSNTSQVTDQWIGDPERGDQLPVQVLTESVVERFNRSWKGTVQSAPTGGNKTPGGSTGTGGTRGQK